MNDDRSVVRRTLPFLAVGLIVGWMWGGFAQPRQTDNRPAKLESKLERRADTMHGSFPLYARGRVRHLVQADNLRDQTRELIELANAVPVDEIEAWLDREFLEVKNDQALLVFHQVLEQRLLETDPERLLRRALRLDHERTKQFISDWARNDPAAADAFVLSQSSSAQRRKLMQGLVKGLADGNPARAIELLPEMASLFPRLHFLSQAVHDVGEANWRQLLAASDAWPRKLRWHARQEATGRWLAEDYMEAVQWLTEQPGGKEMFASTGSYDRSIGVSLLEHADDLPEGWLAAAIDRQPSVISEGAPLAWLKADAETLGLAPGKLDQVQWSAAAHLARNPERREDLRAFLNESAATNPKLRRSLLDSALRAWGSDDREGALAWVTSLGDPELREAGREKLEKDREMREQSEAQSRRPVWPRGSAPEPMEVIAVLADESERNGQVNLGAMRMWTARETEEMIAALRTLPAADRTRAAAALLQRGKYSLGPSILAEAAGVLLQSDLASAQEDKLVSEAVNRVASSWGALNPAAAAEWVRRLPAGENRREALRNLMQAWSRLSESEARAWAESLGEAERADLSDLLKE